MAQIENYHAGGLDIMKDLRINGISRLKHDVTKLSTVLREQQQLVTGAKVRLSNNSLPATRCNQISNNVEQHESKILRMLDNLQL